MIQPAPFPPSPLPQHSEKLRILPLTDLHLPKAESKLIAANCAYLARMDYLVLLGDMVRAYATDLEYGAVREFMEEVALPFTPVCGNHEWHFEEFGETSGLYGEVWAQASDEEQEQKIAKFKAFYGVDEVWRSFQTPLGHFVFLSLDKVGFWKQEALSDQALHFLEREVESAGNAPLFIFCHAPLMLRERLKMVYYEKERTACVEITGDLREALENRAAPTFWMSGHIHLHPEHPLFPPYRTGGNVWQIHCPDGWGYGRWNLQQWVPQRYKGPFSRHLEIDAAGVTFVTHDHVLQQDRDQHRVDY